MVSQELYSFSGIFDGMAIFLKRSVTSLRSKLCFPQVNVVVCELHLKECLPTGETPLQHSNLYLCFDD